MRKVILLTIAASLLALTAGCSGGGTTTENADKLHEMETRVNKEAMEKNPPPPGEGPSN